MAKRKRDRSKLARPSLADVDPNVPVHDFFASIQLETPGGLDDAVETLIVDIESGYFLQWEAVVRQEQGWPLSPKQQQVLDALLDFSDDEDEERILYIDEIPRPKEPWYDIARKIVPALLREPVQTDAVTYQAIYEGWPSLVEVLETHGPDLSLPEDATSPLDIFPVDLQHRLWLQTCFDALVGLGQSEDLTLANAEQQDRVAWFTRLLRDHKETVEYFHLTLETLLTRIVMPPQDEAIFIRMMMDQLGLTSPQEPLAPML